MKAWSEFRRFLYESHFAEIANLGPLVEYKTLYQMVPPLIEEVKEVLV